MARIKRKSIELNDQSLKDLMQETYNDSHQLRSTLVALFNNWNSKVKELGEVAAAGKEIVSVIQALARNQDQKIAIMKILADIVYKDKTVSSKEGGQKSSTQKEGEETLSEETKENLRKVIEKLRENGEIEV